MKKYRVSYRGPWPNENPVSMIVEADRLDFVGGVACFFRAEEVPYPEVGIPGARILTETPFLSLSPSFWSSIKEEVP